MQPEEEAEGRPLVRNRTMDILVALLLLVVSGIVIYDTMRLGIGWNPGEGPAAGYFPFYIAVALAIGSLVTLIQALMGMTDDPDDTFVTAEAFVRVLTVLLPSIGFVALIEFLGIYVAATIFIAFFMVAVGREGILKSVAVGILVPVALFLMFEKWFLVPLPKGPLEAMLGFA